MIKCWVARIPGYDIECRASRTLCRNYDGMKGRRTLVEVSHTKVESVVGKGMSFRIREEGED